MIGLDFHDTRGTQWRNQRETLHMVDGSVHQCESPVKKPWNSMKLLYRYMIYDYIMLYHDM